MIKKIGIFLLAVLLFTACFTVAEELSAAETAETAAGSEVSAAEEGPVSEAPAQPKKLIALTFDDGPDKKMTAPTLDVLEKYGVHATFFLLGTKIDAESAPLVERAVSLGCEIGCHGWDHSNMRKVSLEMTQKNLRRFINALEQYVPVPVSFSLVRPPAGHSNAKVERAVGELGYGIALWDVDSLDWMVQKVDSICENVCRKATDGSIVLMHDRHRPTPDALDILIPMLREQGYEFVTVSELLIRNGEEIVPGGEYRCMPPKVE